MIRGAMACPGGAGVYFFMLNTTTNASEYMELLKKRSRNCCQNFVLNGVPYHSSKVATEFMKPIVLE